MRPVVIACLLAFLSGCGPSEETIRRLAADEMARHAAKQFIKPGNVIGPYTPAVRAGDVLFVSGQIALDPASGNLVNETIEKETRQVLANLDRVLKASGFDSSHVVSATVYLKNMADYGSVNGIYGQYFPPGRYPARVAVQVAALPRDANIEIAAIAIRP